MKAATLDHLAELFKYPRRVHGPGLHELAREVGGESAAAGAALDRFARAVTGLSLEAQQELYVRTFEMNPLCSLEVGWQLYGEHYERGAFLVRMRQTLRALELAESPELPDHLTHVLEMVGRMPDTQRNAFVTDLLEPAMVKMNGSLAETDNPYRHLLQAICNLIEATTPRMSEEVTHER